MISLTELRAMLNKNKIRGYVLYNKSELIDVLIKRCLLPETIIMRTITLLPEREKKTRKKQILNITFQNTYAIVQRWLRSEILKRIKLLYIVICMRPLRL